MELFPDFTDLPQLIFTVIFWGMAILQIFWLFFFYSRIAFHREKDNESSHPPVSIIIAARNEEDNLFEFLPFILEQDYKEFEVIVVNHQSVDNTEYILKAYKEKYPHLKIINIEKNHHLAFGKKLPLTIGIKGSKHEHLLFTDADCKPASNQWLKLMSSKFTPKKNVVLGYAPHRKEGGLLNKIIRIDTTFIALNYLSFAKAGVPYMGVGRNLGYTKEVFLNNSGFKSHYSIPSGDDDLFIQEVAKKRNYTVSLSPLRFCYSAPKSAWSDWLSQKTRHYTTSSRYSVFKKLLLGIYPLSLLLLLISFVTLIAINGITWISLGAIIFMLLSKWLIFGFALKKLKQTGFTWSILIWDLIYAIFIPILYYTSEQSTGSKWK